MSQSVIQKLKKLGVQYREAEAEAESWGAKKSALKSEILEILQAEELQNIKLEDIGMFGRVKKWSFKLPPTGSKERQDFFEWYTKKFGVGEAKRNFGLQSNTFNSLMAQEYEASLDKGEVVFKVPGVEDPKEYESLSVRKG